MIKKILITGSSGMIGTALCGRLIKEDIDFIGLDKAKNKWNLETDARTVMFDLTNRNIDDLASKLKTQSIDMIIHLAANARVWELVKDTTLAIDNIEMTNNVYRLADKLGIKKIIIASSREVYGDSLKKDNSLKETEASHLNAANQYSAGKLCTESLASAYKITHDINTIVVRFSNVYGKYDSSDRFIPLMIKNMLKGKDVIIYGGRDKKMDFTYIDDTIEGLLIVIDSFEIMKNIKMNVLNISTGKSVSLFSVAEKIKKNLNKKIKISLSENRPGEPMYYTANIERISSFGYSPKFDINKGLNESIKYYKKIYK
jgi:UDP-glucose 4-epimerase